LWGLIVLNTNKIFFLILGLCGVQMLCGSQGTGTQAVSAPFALHACEGIGTQNPFDIPRISQERITLQQHKLAVSLQFHKYLKIGLNLGGTAVCGYVIWRFLAWFFSRGSHAHVSVPTGVVADQLSAQDGKILLDALKKMDPPWLSWQWLKNNALAVVNSLGISAGVMVLEQIKRKVMHENTIEWFVSERTRLKELTNEVKAYQAQTLSPQGTREQPKELLYFHRVTLAGMARELVCQAEAIVGFMEYRLAVYQKQGALVMPDELLQPVRVVATINAAVIAARNMLPAPNIDSLEQVRAVCEVVAQAAVELQQMVNRFQGIEYSILWRQMNK
jgi:hypothetical protein